MNLLSSLKKYKIPILAGLVLLFPCRKKTDILGVLGFLLYCRNNVWFVDSDHPRSGASQRKQLKNIQELSKLYKEQKKRQDYLNQQNKGE